jgi:acetolactate synthase I/III small subunit
VTGDSGKIKAFISLVRPLGIKEIVRSGKTALARSVQHENNNHRHPKD